ncbi:hypothetical protein [Salinicola tamaricis]|uniref:hypothetical protein n=1 Tax=Salinicola tamaricis TaxID=1771309 RepID=UPI000D0A0A69|nr:hypothetical protein [Salinicola tamaricis]
MLCGCDARHYGWLRTLGATHEVVAMVTEAPWQHATRVEGVLLYYPSEVFSLCRRFEVDYLVYATPAERDAIERVAPAAHVWQAHWCHGIEGLTAR